MPEETKQRSLAWIKALTLVGIIAYGFELRVQAALQSDVVNPLRADAGQYFAYAYNLRHHGIYSRLRDVSRNGVGLKPDAIRSPGYPIFLLPFSGKPVNYRSILSITVAQAILSTLTIVLVFLIARKFLPHWAAFGAAALTSLSPHLVNANIFVLTESLFTFILLVSAWALVRTKEESHSLWLLLIGCLVGALSLVRPSAQYLPLLMAGFYFIKFRWPVALKFGMVTAIGFILIFGPWLVRNLHSVGQPTNDYLKIATLHHGIYPNFMYRDDPRTYGFPYRYNPRSPEIKNSIEAVLAEIKRRFVAEPGRHLKWYLIGKPIALWQWNLVQGGGGGFVYPVSRTPYMNVKHFQITHRAMEILHTPLVILGLIGSLFVWSTSATKILGSQGSFAARAISVFLIYFTVVHSIGAPFPRYAVPLRPLLYAMAFVPIIVAIMWLSRLHGTSNPTLGE